MQGQNLWRAYLQMRVPIGQDAYPIDRHVLTDPLGNCRGTSETWVQGGGWAAWAATAPSAPKPTKKVARLRESLRGELRSALRHAYLGPEVVSTSPAALQY